MSSDFGSSLFKVQGEEASPADTMSVLQAIVENKDARMKCGGLSTFIRDLPLAQREERAQSMVSIYFSVHAPPPWEDEKQPHGSPTTNIGWAVTPAFANTVCPPPFSKWKNHIQAVYDKRGKASSATVVSREVASILHAIEQLWGVSGHLLRP